MSYPDKSETSDQEGCEEERTSPWENSFLKILFCITSPCLYKHMPAWDVTDAVMSLLSI